VVWCGVVWCGVVWCGVVWCGWRLHVANFYARMYARRNTYNGIYCYTM